MPLTLNKMMLNGDGESLLDIIEDNYIPEPNSGCWLWLGWLDPDGYGRFRFRGHGIRAHRVSYEIFKEPIQGDLLVCHQCDVPCCINPEHLFLGTQKENIVDRDKKKRMACGERQGASILTEEAVRQIASSTESQLVLATRYGVATSTIGSIQCGNNWKHLTLIDWVRQPPPTGIHNGNSRLSESDVITIRHRITQGISHRDIANEFGVCPSTISGINTGRIWSHLC